MSTKPDHRLLVESQKFQKELEKITCRDKQRLRWHNGRRWRLIVEIHYDNCRRNHRTRMEEQLYYDY